jgi:hypothetical protein
VEGRGFITAVSSHKLRMTLPNLKYTDDAGSKLHGQVAGISLLSVSCRQQKRHNKVD